MSRAQHSLENVFGLQRRVPETYVQRNGIDDQFRDALYGDKHIVLRGDSKQGKTSLRRNVLPEEICIVVQCQPDWTINDINRNILRRSGYQIIENVDTKETVNRTAPKLGASILGLSAEIGGDKTDKDINQIKRININIDISDPNEIIYALKEIGINKYIVLEDFHYLPLLTQRHLAGALKAFYDSSEVIFILVGVWRESNRLEMLNGDLQERIIDIPADHWSSQDLFKIIEKGENLLNVKFDDQFKNMIVRDCYDGVYIVQEACKKLCLRHGIRETQSALKRIGNSNEANLILDQIHNEHNARCGAFVANFLNLSKYAPSKNTTQDYISIIISLLILPIEQIQRGITFDHILETKGRRFPKLKNFEHSLRTALIEIAQCQSSAQIKPTILVYDNNNAKLNVVDRGFLFWLSKSNRRQLMQEHGFSKY